MEIKEFLIKTLLPYKLDPNLRSVSKEGRCLFEDEKGNKCALGRWVKKKYFKKIHEKDINDTGAIILFSDLGRKCLKKKALAMNLTHDEWTLIQNVHDCNFSIVHIDALEEHFKIDLKELK